MPAPLSRERREAIADDIRAGIGCNQTARNHHVAPSTVSGIAREHGLHFDDEWMTTTAVTCRRNYAELDRMEREDDLIEELLALPQTSRARDGRETKAHRRLTYALYDVNRHHGRQNR